ncbi:MAG TPA: MFS transporter [Puia sp.]|jgi:ACS family hexuronate transporter-like MFS transporter
MNRATMMRSTLTSVDPVRPGNYRWVVCGLLFFATTINYLDRQVVGLLKPTLEQKFQWTETDYSHIVMAFTAAYAIGLLFFGRIIDRVGSKMGYTVSVTIWSLAAMLHAAVTGTSGFTAARTFLGLGESGNFPAAIRTVTEWFPKKERALATGFFDSGSNIGALVAPVIVPWILGSYGWQAAFLITGVIGFGWLIAWRTFYETPARQKRLGAAELEYIQEKADKGVSGSAAVAGSGTGASGIEASGTKASGTEGSGTEGSGTEASASSLSWVQLFGLRQTWAFIVGKFFTDPIWYFFLFWLPSYFSNTFHLDLKKPSLPLILVYSGATIGALGGGYLSSMLIKRGWPVYKARKTALLLSALAVLPIVLSRYTTSVWSVVGLICLAVAGNAAWSANIFTIVSDMLPKKAVSSVVGIGSMAGAVGGVLFPMFIGFVLDYYKGMGRMTAGYNVIFIFCGISYLIAWVLIHFITPKMRPVE